MDENDAVEDLVERVAALDIGKVGLVACVRVPHQQRPGRRQQEVREYGTTMGALVGLADDLRRQGVTLASVFHGSGDLEG
ncbi:hypothetical protein O7626_03915 [Micromonospora sp. WMMD1102]|uniref:hypothetical protein n=1 Tax=Micromonospora sp. WMMD1102 TaxID=3016105 RepID=UPI002414E3BD|nr:hypothetical protein [Micromonospora sp. WMMD1102]MDG4785084.1 hypothetical protein [Micromonospora sp. WMMD1102]